MQAGSGNQSSLYTIVRRAAFDLGDLKIWLPKIKQSLQDGADPNNTNPSMGKGPLHAAAENGMFEVVQLLLKHGADPNIKTHKAAAPLHFAVQYGYIDIVELLLKNNADPNSEAEGCLTPLLLVSVCYTGQRPAGSKIPVGRTDVLSLRIAQLLIEYGADPTIKDGVTGETPLHHAMSFTPIPVEYVKLLIRAGAQPLARSNTGESVIDLLLDSGYTKSKDKDLILDIMTNAPAAIEEGMRRKAQGKETKLAEREVLYQQGSTQST
ncbi:Ankyrin-3 [Arthrobotrys entomopaga]|nr:Ankyrin-3 [Arthrobotrys entomopaga]